MESMTLWAFSWPISGRGLVLRVEMGLRGRGTLVVVDYVAEVIATAVMGFAHTHGVVREVDIAVVTWQVVVRTELVLPTLLLKPTKE